MRSLPRRLATLIVAVTPGLAGCGRSAAAEAAPTRASAARSPAEEARQIFAERCAPCHGEHGQGDGPAARECSPRPADLSDGARLSRLSDGDLRALVLLGGRATGRSNMMPPNADLKGRDEVVRALLEIVRAFALR